MGRLNLIRVKKMYVPGLTIDKTRHNSEINNIRRRPGKKKNKCSEEVGRIQTSVKRFLSTRNFQI